MNAALEWIDAETPHAKVLRNDPTTTSTIFCWRVRLFQSWVYEEFSRFTSRTNASSTRSAVRVPPP
jgi:hypothetical protein